MTNDDDHPIMSGEAIEEAIAAGTSLARGDFSNREDLEDMDFSNGNFEKATFAGSRLDCTSFRGANLDGADFTGAYMGDADLLDASIQGAIFINVNLDGAVIDATRGDAIGLVRAGSDPRGYLFYGIWYDNGKLLVDYSDYGDRTRTYTGWVVKAGCRYFAMEDAKEHWGPEADHPYGEQIMPMLEKIESTPAPTRPAR